MSKALTLVESTNPKHQKIAADLISKCLPLAGNSTRIAISGSPGVGKSTIIEALGLHIIQKGFKPAVLAVDPTSDISHGSILGDKTRMERLSKNEKAFIRPSPTSGTLGGVTKKTFEAIVLCEAAGYDTVFIETVGVGQSETFAQKLSDIFILLVAPGGGDELQGIKRGIVELADIIVVNKAEDDRKVLSNASLKAYKNATHLAQEKLSGFPITILPCSALHNTGIDELWNQIEKHRMITRDNDYHKQQRDQQNIFWAKSSLEQSYLSLLQTDARLNELVQSIVKDVSNGVLSPEKASTVFFSKLRIDIQHD